MSIYLYLSIALLLACAAVPLLGAAKDWLRQRSWQHAHDAAKTPPPW
ncbi:hypothetical protein AAFF27_15880 [Xylophilus sp. GW821-FHT01B05]|jgi:hypothetical protein